MMALPRHWISIKSSFQCDARLLLLASQLSWSSAVTAAPALMSWQSIVTEAKRNNAELQALELEMSAAKNAIAVSQAPLLPSLSADLSAGLSGREGSASATGLQDNKLLAKPVESNAVSITANQNIFDGYATRSKIAQSEAQFRILEAQRQQLKAQLSFELKQAYANLLQAQRTLRLYSGIINRRQENLRLVELRYASGQENKGSVLLSEAYLQQARYDELQAKGSLETARAALRALLGRNDKTELVVSEDIPQAVRPETLDLQWVAQQSPNQRLKMAQEEEARASLALAGAGFYPSLGLRGTLGRQDEVFFPKQGTWSLSLILSVPLYSGGRDLNLRESARHKLLAAALNKEQDARETMTSLQRYLSGFQEAIEKLKVDESFLKAVLVRAEIARSKYNNGLTSFDDWDLIESDLIQRQRAVLASQSSRIIAEAAWEQSQGKGAIP